LKLNINLIPRLEFEKRPLGKFLQWALTYGRYIIIGTEIIVLMAFFSRFKFDRDLTDLHELVGQKEAIVAAAQGLEEDVRSLELRLKEVKSLGEKSASSTQILKILEGIVPPDVVLKEINLDQGKLTLLGSAISNFGLNYFLTNLTSSNKFSRVTLEEVSRGAGGQLTNFKLNCFLKRTL